MFEVQTFEELIRSSGILGNRRPASTGWWEVKCAVCRDYKFRGGFKFDAGSGKCAYHCFNCGHLAVYNPTAGKFSQKMLTVLSSFGVDIEDAKSILFAAFTTEQVVELTEEQKILLPAKQLTLPEFFQPIEKSDPEYRYVVERGFDIDTWKWHKCVGKKTKETAKWYNRLIVPIYNHRGQCVFYQGRAITPDIRKRWESSAVPKSSVIFNHAAIYNSTEPYLVVCEGVFDALSVNGVAIQGSEFTQYQLAELDKFRGTKVIVPNKDSRGYEMASQAIKYGFSLSYPDIGTCTDLNEAYKRFGELYLSEQIASNICSGFGAEIKLDAWCKQL